ncbi:MAG: hypothetical protein QOJ11_1488 [Frankiales bacterium]|nr:hypothetical protein [Frankiales bacterium]
MPEFAQVNNKVITAEVRQGQQVIARRGAMLAYSGRIVFSPLTSGQGAGGMLGRHLAGESSAMMLADGDGTIHYGYRGLHTSVVVLDPAGPMSVESDRLLAYDATLQASVVFLAQQGGLKGAVRGAVTGQGLFTTQLGGAGCVAILAHGGTIALPVTPDRPVMVDPQAYVAHTGPLHVEVTASVGWRDAVGRGSGEAIQLKVTGTGTVYVQASEQKI